MVDDHLRQVKDLLDHLYDYAYLQACPLAQSLRGAQELSAREAMRQLRTTLLETIEELRPPGNGRATTPASRSHDVIELHYVECLTVQEVANELALSKRQVYRDLRKAERALATLLRDKLAWANEQDASHDELLMREASRLSDHKEQVIVGDLVEGGLRSITPLAQKRGVRVRCRPGGLDANVYLQRQIVRQALLNTLSWAVQHAQEGSTLSLSAHEDGDVLRFSIDWQPSPETVNSEVGDTTIALPSTAAQLLASLDGRYNVEHLQDRVRFRLAIPVRTPTTLLAIDDNEGMIELLRRYLAGSGYRVVGANDASEGMRLAKDQRPDVIILDVMIPDRDGWQLLQQLKTERETAHIPVIICSVFDDPDLALSLGADHFLPKPVHRAELLRLLSRYQEDTAPRYAPASPR